MCSKCILVCVAVFVAMCDAGQCRLGVAGCIAACVSGSVLVCVAVCVAGCVAV